MTTKKITNLIVGFLTLAVIATSVTFALIGWQSQKEIAKKADSQELAKKTVPEIGANAFSETVPDLTATLLPKDTYPIGDNIPPTIEKDDNLTQRFIKQASYNLIKTNPDGPQQTKDGLGLVGSDLNMPIGIDQKDLDAQNWAKDISSISINIVPDSKESFEEYIKNLPVISNLVKETSTKVKLTIGGTLETTDLKKLRDDINANIYQLSNIPTPQYFSKKQKATLQILYYQKKLAEAGQISIQDPYKVAIILQANKEYLSEINNTIIEENNNLKNDIDKIKNSKQTSLLDELLGVKKAHAVAFPVWFFPGSNTDLEQYFIWFNSEIITYNEITQTAESFWEWLYHTIVRILVKELNNKIQRDLVNWISGGGKPKFVTDWKGTLTGIGNQVAGAIITKYQPKLCQSFGPLVEVALTPISDRADKDTDQITCTLDQVIDNVESFYNSFANGGWIAYATTLRPENQLWGSIFMVDERISRQVNKSKEASTNEKTSSNGFLSGGKTCKNPKKEDSTNGAYRDLLDKFNDHPEGLDSTTCTVGGDENGHCTITFCDPDDYRINTPGSAVGHSLFGSLNWKVGQVNVASSLEELVGALIDASINRLINLTLTWATNAISGNGGGDNSDVGGGISCSNAQSTGCNPTSAGVDAPTGRPLVDGIPSSGDGNQTANVTQFGQNKIDKIQKTIDDYNKLKELLLTGEANKCPNDFAQQFGTTPLDIAQRLQQAYEAFNPSLPEAIGIIQGLIGQLQGLDQSKPEDAKKINDINNQIAKVVDDAKLKQFKGMIDAYLKNQIFTGFKCPVPPTP